MSDPEAPTNIPTPHDIAILAGTVPRPEAPKPVRSHVLSGVLGANAADQPRPVMPAHAREHARMKMKEDPDLARIGAGIATTTTTSMADEEPVVPLSARPKTPTARARANSAGSAPPLTPGKDSAAQIQAAQARDISVRQIKAYIKWFRVETEEIIPSNWSALSDKQLNDISLACDSILGQGQERAALMNGIPIVLNVYESAVMPFMPPSTPFAHCHGISTIVSKEFEHPNSELTRAMTRLAIRYTGKMDAGPWQALGMELGNLMIKFGNHQKQYNPNPDMMERLSTKLESTTAHTAPTDPVEYDT